MWDDKFYDFEDGDEYAADGGQNAYGMQAYQPAANAIPHAGAAEFFNPLVASHVAPEDEGPTWKNVSADPQREMKYQVQLGRLLVRRGVAFDTNTIFDRFNAKTGRVSGGTDGQGKLSEVGGAQYAGATTDHKLTWKRSLIWVLSEDNRVYSHVCKLRRFHHTSFTNGSVRAAGMWIVEFGKIKKISGHSGHYRPEIRHFLNMLRLLNDHAALHADTEALVWENSSDSWKYVGAKQVLDSDGHGYEAHP